MKQFFTILALCSVVQNYSAETLVTSESALVAKKEEASVARSRSKSPERVVLAVIKPAESRSIVTALHGMSHKEVLEAVKRHPCLRAPRVEGTALILDCITNNRTYSNDRSDYPAVQVQELLDLGVPINQQDWNGRTALTHVVQGWMERQQNSIPLTQGLLDHRADPTVQDNEGKNAVLWAFGGSESGRQLLAILQHEKIPSIINNKVCIAGEQKTYLNAFINYSGNLSKKSKSALAMVRAGAIVTQQDIIDARKQNYGDWKKFLNHYEEQKD